MDTISLLNLFILIFVLVILPGPANFAVLSTSTRYNLISSVFLSAGVTFGDIIYVLAVLFSFNVFASFLEPIFFYIRIIGAIYICYLGITLILKKPESFKETKVSNSLLGQFIIGLMICISNPKTIIFYFSVLPQFINLKSVNIISSTQITLVIAITVFFGLCLFGLMGQAIRKYLLQDRSKKVFNVVSGMLFLAVGFYLIKT